MTRPNAHRRFLLASAITLGGTVMAAGLWHNKRNNGQRHAGGQIDTTFASMIDTLVPRDEQPGGLDAGLEHSLTQRMAEQPKLNELVTRLLPIIERRAMTEYHRAFYQLTVDQRERLLSDCLNDRSKPLVQRDITQFRRQVLTPYYESPIGRQSIGYQLPATYPNYLA